MSLLELFYKLKEENIFVWLKDDNNLGYSFKEEGKFTDSLKQELKNKKIEAIKLLKLNQSLA